MCKHLPASSVYLHVFVRVRSFSLGAVMFKATHFFLPLSLTVTKLQLLLPLRNVTFFSPSNSRSQSSHYSLALVASASLKIKLTHSASLLCSCNYKSSLSLCEQGEKRASGPASEQWRGSWARRRESCFSPAESPLDRP